MKLRWLLVMIMAACGRDPAVVRQWLVDWESARACMLPGPEYGPDSKTAYLVSELREETDAKCAKARSRLLVVSDEDAAAIPDWPHLRNDVSAFVSMDMSSIDRIDTRVARLRAQVRMSEVARVRRNPVPLGKLTDLGLDDSADFERGRIHGVTQGKVLEVRSPSNVRMTRISDPDDPRAPVLSYPSRGWTASARGDVLRIHELDRSADVREVPLPGEYYASRAMDRDSFRLVVLQSLQEGFGLAISSDAGRTWAFERSPDPLPLTQTSQDIDDGTIDAIVQSVGHSYIHRFRDRASFDGRIELADTEVRIGCRSSDALWSVVRKGTELLHVTLPTSTLMKLPSTADHIEDCYGGSALLMNRRGRSDVMRCRDECRRVHAPTHDVFRAAAVLLDDETWVYAAVNKSIVGVWREGAAEPSFFRLPEPVQLVRAVVLDHKVQLVVEARAALQLVELPVQPASSP